MKVGLYTLCIIALMAIVAPAISRTTYDQIALESVNQPPSWAHWFGTDDLGRDLWVRVWMGARISLCVGIIAALIDLALGVAWGSLAALSQGRVDEIMMRTADILFALPYLLVVTLLMVVMGPGMFTILIAMTIIGWITMARIVRGQILSLKDKEYILASKALGASFGRIVWRHLIPNASGPIIVTLTLTIRSAIFVEAFLSFLGLGIQAPIASWGTMASEGLSALQYYPWRLFFPGLMISMTILAFQMIGDGLSDFLSLEEAV